jgi:hypothetical protein
MIEHFDPPTTARGAQTLVALRRWAADELGGRTVWCMAAWPTGRDAAHRLRHRLQREDGELSVAEAGTGERIAPGDVVVLHDPPSAGMARLLREHGVHVVLHVHAPRFGPLLEPHAAAVDAYVIARRGRDHVDRVAALIPCADVVSATETPAALAGNDDLGWSTVLADVVHGDRDETVGGTLHARPAVPPR